MIRILLLEDNPVDADLIEKTLQRSRVHAAITRVVSEQAFRRELVTEPDLILADHNLPSFDGMSALRIARDIVPDVPFIFVSGTIDEEAAAAALREGATDYILKDRPARLPTAIERALAERETRRTRERVQQSLRASEQRFYLATEATRDVIWDCDLISGTTIMNDAIRDLWGYDLEGPVTPDWWVEKIHPDDRQRVRDVVETCIGSRSCTRWSVEYRFRRADGVYGVVFDRGIILRGRNGAATRMIGAMQDVTERAEALRALSEAQRVAHLGSWSYHPGSDVITLSEEAARIFGTSLHALSLHEYLSFFDPADRERARELIMPPAVPAEAEEHVIRPDGATRVVHCRVERSELKDHFVGTMQDVTEQRRLEQQIEQERRVSSLGRVAATMAHEFNNVLMAIQPFVEIVKRRAASDEKLQNAAASIRNSIQRGRRVTNDILRVANPGQPTARKTELGAWLRDVVGDLSAALPARISVDLRIPDEPLFVHIDDVQLQQALTNLAVNAADAMPAGGTLTIAASRAAGDVEITVSDTGEGIPPEHLPRVFEPLFTTKNKGTGLGLAVVQQFVVMNHGTVTVESVRGVGTTFRIVLQAVAATE